MNLAADNRDSVARDVEGDYACILVDEGHKLVPDKHTLQIAVEQQNDLIVLLGVANMQGCVACHYKFFNHNALNFVYSSKITKKFVTLNDLYSIYKMKLEYIKCHGSGNEFIMLDAVAQNMDNLPLAALSEAVCSRDTGNGADGVLLLVKNGEGVYGMRMFNPDGSEAEMCGNGIRCVARLAQEYVGGNQFDLTSGGKVYPTACYAPVYGDIPTYGVEIGVKLWSDDFRMQPSAAGDFIDRVIGPLHPTYRWSAISVGNPHIVARVDSIDIDVLTELGQKVIMLKDIFPNGVNISLVEVVGKNRIFVATYERGAGITASCGTAMTSSATAMALQGLCDYGVDIAVLNKGGMVRCVCKAEGGLSTTLIGNASYIERGEIEFDGKSFVKRTLGYFDDEIASWREFSERLAK